jgi:hypothetical protein
MKENKTVRIDYDDLTDDVINKINKLLQEHHLKLEFDNKPHDGFELLSLVKL